MEIQDFNTGDIVFHIYTGRFGKVARIGQFTNALTVKADNTDGYVCIWMIENVIKVDQDTPQNRLAIQLKYG